MPRLGLGLGLGLGFGRLTNGEPSLVSAGSIDQQPLVGDVPIATPPVFSGATSTALQWWNGNPDAGGVAIAGATSLSWVPTDAEFGGTLYLRHTATGPNGSSTSTAVAPDVVGRVYTESWAGYSIGDTFAQLDAAYDRTNASFATTVGADATAPSGKSVTVAIQTSSNLRLWPASFRAFGDANQSNITVNEDRILFLHTGENLARYHFKPITAATSSLPGLIVYNGSARMQIGGEDENSNVGTLMATLTPGTLYWWRGRRQGTSMRGKLWVYGDPEPPTWTERITGSPMLVSTNTIAQRYALTHPANAYSVLWWSMAFNAPAPAWPGFVEPAPSSTDLMTFAAPSESSLISGMGSLLTFSVEDVP